MDDGHLSVELLRAAHRGDQPLGELAIVAITHLFDDCPTCRAAFEAWRQESRDGMTRSKTREYDEAFERVRKRLSRQGRLQLTGAGVENGLAAHIEQERAIATDLAEMLLSTPRRERSQRLRDLHGKCSGPLVADALLERIRGFLPGRPEEAFEAASLARMVLQSERLDAVSCEIYARALAHQANARKVQGNLLQADDTLEVARYLLKTQGGGDRLTRAEMDRIEGSLRFAQRRFTEAESMYARAIINFALEEEDFEVATTLIALGTAYDQSDEIDRAIEVTHQALEILGESEHPRFQFYARHNLVHFLVRAGRIREAEELFSQIQDLYVRYSDPLSSLRRIWLEGHLARGRNDLEAAANHYEAVRHGFISRGIGYDAAMAALDLAALYAEQGRTAELKQIAEEIIPVFEAQDLHREAAAALMLFQDAVRTEQVTLGYVLELTRYLQRARLDPALQFRVPT